MAVTDIEKDAAAAVATALGGEACAVHLAVTDASSVGAAVEHVTAVLGPIDVLINNAGWDRIAPFVDTDEDLWDRLIAINLKGVLHTCRTIAPQMTERRSGRIINISSDAGRVGSTGEAATRHPPRPPRPPRKVAAAVAFLASDDASFVTGQTLSVSGGLTMS